MPLDCTLYFFRHVFQDYGIANKLMLNVDIKTRKHFIKKYQEFSFLFFFLVVSPTDFHPALSQMNELIQSGMISESHCHLQEVSLFSAMFGKISDDPIRGMRNLHGRFPAAVLFQELIKNSVTGWQAYNIYLGKHNVSKQLSGNARNMDLPTPSGVNHFGLSLQADSRKTQYPWYLMVYSSAILKYFRAFYQISQK